MSDVAMQEKVDPMSTQPNIQEVIKPKVDDSKIHWIDISKVHVLAERGRKSFQNIDGLANSILKFGLLVPIILDENYNLVDGERRFRACMLCPTLALSLPADQRPSGDHKAANIVAGKIRFMFQADIDSLTAKEIELEANLQREALTWQEESFLWAQIHELKVKKYGDRNTPASDPSSQEQQWSIAKTAELVGASETDTQKKIKIAKKLNARPELAARVANLPLNRAIVVVSQIEQTERIQKQADSGQIKFDATLVNDSCLNHIKTLADNSVSLILTDPPFGISTIDDQLGGNRGGSMQYTATLKTTDNMTEDTVIELMTKLAPDLYRVLKPGSTMLMFFSFNLYSFLDELFTKVGFAVQDTPLIWYKKKTTSPFSGYQLSPCYEAILVCTKPRADRKQNEPFGRRLNEPENVVLKTVLEFTPLESKRKIHPFQKPIELLAALIKIYTNLGEVVYDPFAGSAATLIAGKEIGRSVIGSELDKERFTIAQGRLLTTASL